MKRISVAVDFSSRSDRALHRATLLAKSAGAWGALARVLQSAKRKGLHPIVPVACA